MSFPSLPVHLRRSITRRMNSPSLVSLHHAQRGARGEETATNAYAEMLNRAKTQDIAAFKDALTDFFARIASYLDHRGNETVLSSFGRGQGKVTEGIVYEHYGRYLVINKHKRDGYRTFVGINIVPDYWDDDSEDEHPDVSFSVGKRRIEVFVSGSKGQMVRDAFREAKRRYPALERLSLE